MKVGDKVWQYVDTGCSGARALHGVVVKVNRVTVVIRTEYGDRVKVTKEFAENMRRA